MESKDNRLRLIINFKNDETEIEMYKYIKGLKFEGHSSYIKKLIYEDMKSKGLIK